MDGFGLYLMLYNDDNMPVLSTEGGKMLYDSGGGQPCCPDLIFYEVIN